MAKMSINGKLRGRASKLLDGWAGWSGIGVRTADFSTAAGKCTAFVEMTMFF
jgi:hypothetical protein